MHSKYVLYAYDRGYRVTSDEGDVVMSPFGNEKKLRTGRWGYLGFSIKCKSKGIDGVCHVHKLAALQWFGYDAVTAPGIHIRHLDGNKLNNKRENLALGTPHQNQMDRPREERVAHAKKAAKAKRVFTDDQVRDIRRKKKEGATLSQLVAEYGAAKATISYVVNWKTYKDVI